MADRAVNLETVIGMVNTYFRNVLNLNPDLLIDGIVSLPTVDVVEVVRCKDCKHRPTGSNRDDLEFPDDKCPCQCEDYWYSWKPADEWYCGNGERKDGDG